jgi:hypothetical protein
MKNVSEEGTPGTNRGLWGWTYLTFAPYITATNFIRALRVLTPTLHVGSPPSKRYHIQWLTSFAASTGHDLCGLRENFGPCARWRNTIGVARATSRFAKGNGANNNKKGHQLPLRSDGEDDKGSRGGSSSSRDTPEADSKGQKQLRMSLHPSTTS